MGISSVGCTLKPGNIEILDSSVPTNISPFAEYTTRRMQGNNDRKSTFIYSPEKIP